MQIGRTQAEELMMCINENAIPQFFDKIDSYQVKSPQINQLRREFISGFLVSKKEKAAQEVGKSGAAPQIFVPSPSGDSG